jgi:superfamily II DNA or RNA helicase
MNTVKPDAESENRDQSDVRRRLEDALAEIDRLRSENARLKSVLETFSLRRASDLTHNSHGRQVPLLKEDFIPAVTIGAEGGAKGSPSSDSAVLSPDKKIGLFRSLFRGREDVYAVRWQSRNGKSGYSPACAHEWDPLLCKKPCSKCSNSQYIPISDEAIREHLVGKKVLGVYPLLTDDTCWFLAADFDKAGWQEDSVSFLDTCRSMGVPAYLERSRSGKGGHVWIFFEEAVPAGLARKLGCALLTRTMERWHQIGFESYDRFFPSQDTMPKGGFGNLIALPLQHGPRKKENSVFLDDSLDSAEDQWSFLENMARMPSSAVETLVEDASRSGAVVGVRMPLTENHADEDPWTLPPSRRHADKPLKGPLPEKIIVVRSNQMYLDKEGLSSALMNRLIRLAAFQNPEFYAAQAMRLSTFGKPRIISCAEESPRHLALPRGCLDDLRTFLDSQGISMEIQDERSEGRPVEIQFVGQLNAEQEKVAAKIADSDDGVLSAPTGFGKTVLGAWIIGRRKTNTLILVHRTALMDQWRQQLATFLGLDPKDIGVIGGGPKRVTGIIDVGMIQSLQRKGEVKDLVADYGQVIVDECHHVSAFTFERIMREAKAKYVLGLTATPIRKDGHHPVIFMQCGPIRERIHPRRATAQRPFEHNVLLRPTTFCLESGEEELTVQQIYAALATDATRNAQIVHDVKSVMTDGRCPLVLTERVQHLTILADALLKTSTNIFVLRGGMGKKQRKAVLDQLAAVPDKEPRVILATGRYIGEGFDDARLDTLFLAMPVSWRGTLQQYVGRLHRLHHDKLEVRVYDYADQKVPMLMRMLTRRLRGYHALGYAIDGQMVIPEAVNPSG